MNRKPALGAENRVFEQAFRDHLQDMAQPLPFDLSTEKTIAVAVSGGADSMALCLLLARFYGTEKILALIVDHGLRPESGQEAVQVQKWLAGHKINAVILPWQASSKPESGLQDKARQARYDILLQHCKAQGCTALFLAHHGDDQIETFLMRLCAGSALGGLQAMRPVIQRDDIHILRPLLPFDKASLTGFLQGLNQQWIEDPSNQKQEFTRVRMRGLLPILKEEGLSTGRFAQLSRRIERMEKTLDSYADIFLAQQAKFDRDFGFITVPQSAFTRIDDEIAIRALRQIIIFIGGQRRGYLKLEKIEKLAARLRQKDVTGFKATLHDCLFDVTASQIIVTREAVKAIAGPEQISTADFVWDGRWKLQDFEGSQVRALSDADVAHFRALNISERANLPIAARQSLPVVILPEKGEKSGEILACPLYNSPEKFNYLGKDTESEI